MHEKANKSIIYKSKPFYFWVLVTLFATILVAVMTHNQKYEETLISLSPGIVGFLIAFIFFNRYIFYESGFERLHPIIKIIRNKYKYSSLHAVEIKKRREPRSWPCVLLHFSQKRTKFSPSFTFNKSQELIPLLDCLIKNNVLILLNYTSDYLEEREFIKDYIVDKGGSFELIMSW